MNVDEPEKIASGLPAPVPRMDLRIRRTRQLLWQALLELLETTAWDSISIQDLCTRAMVHRTTFYKHFESKDDLLEQGFNVMVQQQMDMLPFPAPARPGDGPRPPMPQPDMVRLFLDHVVEYRSLYAFIFSKESSNSHTYTIRRIMADLAEARVTEMVARLGLTVPAGMPPLPLLANYQSGAMLSIIAWWFENGMTIPREELAIHINRLMDLRKLLD